MKPANFPEKINQRRKRALVRLDAAIAAKGGTADRYTERDILVARISPSLRDVRTKKDRSARGKRRLAVQ